MIRGAILLDLLGVAGVILVVYGAYMVYIPSAYITAGLVLIALFLRIGYVARRTISDKDSRTDGSP